MASCACSKLRKVEIVWRFLRHRHTVVGTIVILSARHVARVSGTPERDFGASRTGRTSVKLLPRIHYLLVSGFEISDEIGIVGKSLLECMSGIVIRSDHLIRREQLVKCTKGRSDG